MKRLLFVTSRFPYPPIGGDRLRVFHLARLLARAFDVDLLGRGATTAAEVQAFCAATGVRSARAIAHSRGQALRGAARALVTGASEMAMIRANPNVKEGPKAKMIEEFEKNAAAAYSKVITRYPAMDRALDAKARLEALHQPVPRPTRAALELNKKELASRSEPSMVSSMMGAFGKRPSGQMERATKVGEPPLIDPTPMNATDVVKNVTRVLAAPSAGPDGKLSVQTVNVTPAPNQEPPRSDDPPAAAPPAVPVGADNQAAPADQAPAPAEPAPNAAPDPNELKPNMAPDPTALPPLQQNNELEGNPAAAASSSTPAAKQEELVDISSSKKRKKGLGKLNPF